MEVDGVVLHGRVRYAEGAGVESGKREPEVRGGFVEEGRGWLGGQSGGIGWRRRRDVGCCGRD